MADKLLTISLLVSGRADTTQKCLDSLRGLLEQLPSELILVDTGCDAGMQKLLRQYTDHIIPFVWCDDFAKARNTGLSAARGEWFLFLDDDEWFEDVTPIIDFFRSGEYQEYHQAVYKARNYSNAEGTAYTDEWVSRMIRIEEDTHFEGRVHEELLPTRGKCKKLDAFVHHYGYVFPDEASRLAHKHRNVRLLEKLIAEEPNNMRWRLELLQEYASAEDAKELRQTGMDAIALVEQIDKPFVNQCRGAFYTAVLMADQWLGDGADTLADADLFLGDTRNTPATKCSISWQAIQSIDKEEDLEQMEHYTAEYIRNYEQDQAQELSEQEQIIEESILFVKDNVTEEKYRAAKRQNLRCCYIEVSMANDRITGDHAGIDYAQMHRMLEEFSDCSLNYARQIYTEEAFSGEMEMLEENIRAAVWIRRMLDCETGDWNSMLDCLRNAAKAWPQLGETVKLAATLIGEEQEKQSEEADAAGKELRQMADQVKKQVAVMVDAGMYAEALGIVRQLRQMLPEDREIARLEKKLEKGGHYENKGKNI